jgi:regulation of enolase protein 1 (concanavalin A-like superfamily)
VRFFYAPVRARAPEPANAAAGVDVDASLNWRPGRDVASHMVYFGTDADAVTNGTVSAETVTKHSYTPASLNFGTTYYWRVDEVNAVTYPGSVWNFTTNEYMVVDDFEGYTDQAGEEIFSTWIDGFTNGLSNSIVGYFTASGGTFGETAIIHSGKQSMPFEYNNVKTPYFSEAEREFSPAQDWTVHGADTLTLYFRGNPAAFAEAAGTITMSAGGVDIWNTADEFRFAYKPLNGDGTMVAKVESVGNSDPWAKAGVMIRESLDPGSRFAAVYATPGNGVRYQARLLNAAAAVSDTSAPATAEQIALKTPVWIKIERKGSSFNCYYSTDGVQWTSMVWNPQTINMGASVYIGLAVTSHNATATTTAEFSNVATTGSVAGTWQVQAIGVDQPANDAASLYVAVQDSAGKLKVVTHPDPAATTQASWQAWQIPLSEFNAGGVNLTRVKKLILGVGDRSKPTPDGAGQLFFDDIGVGHPVQ